MSTTGIVCEFNPFHNGHAHLFAEARKRGAEKIVCVMSGNAVQRGELAVADAYTRAEIALRCGADLVLELPYPWSASSSEPFAEAGIAILSDYVDTVLFGSECGELSYLQGAAEAVESESFQAELADRIGQGVGAATAYFDALASRNFVGLSSNDLLGIAYLRAAKRKGYRLQFDTVKREGAAYRELSLSENEYPSAGALRRLLRESGATGLEPHMPPIAAMLLRKTSESGELTDAALLDATVLAHFRLQDPKVLATLAELGGGLAERICAVAKTSATAEEMFEALRSKHHTDGRLRRAMLFGMTGVRQELIAAGVSYTTLLAANEKGRALLASTRKTRRIPVLTKPADADRTCEQFCAGERLDALFSLARPNPTAMGRHFLRSAYVAEDADT